MLPAGSYIPYHTFLNFSLQYFQVVFEGIRGNNYQGDIALDDISFEDGKCQDTSPPPTSPPGKSVGGIKHSVFLSIFHKVAVLGNCL